MTTPDLRYPIGRFQAESEFSDARLGEWTEQIAATPAQLRGAVENLTPQQLETPYREGGWTVRQVVHHVADSHMNCYTRFRLALTEDEPLIKTYEEARWAELPDARSAAIDLSLALLDALHVRWVLLLKTFGDAEWARTFRHPDLGTMRLDKALQLYAWHGRHHIAQVTSLSDRMGW